MPGRARRFAAVAVLLAFLASAAWAESNCYDGIDNDGDGLIDCDDPGCCFDEDCLLDPACEDLDHDGDGRINSVDCAPDDDQIWEPPGEVPADANVIKTPGAAQIGWSSLAGQAGPATWYDVVSGEIGQLRFDRSIVRAACLADDAVGLTASDARILGLESNGYYYLIRAQNACVPGTGSYGSGSPPAPARVPATACP